MSTGDDVEILVEDNVLLAVVFKELPTGGVDCHVKGYMDPVELVARLREIADHIEQNGPVDHR